MDIIPLAKRVTRKDSMMVAMIILRRWYAKVTRDCKAKGVINTEAFKITRLWEPNVSLGLEATPKLHMIQ